MGSFHNSESTRGGLSDPQVPLQEPGYIAQYQRVAETDSTDNGSQSFYQPTLGPPFNVNSLSVPDVGAYYAPLQYTEPQQTRIITRGSGRDAQGVLIEVRSRQGIQAAQAIRIFAKSAAKSIKGTLELQEAEAGQRIEEMHGRKSQRDADPQRAIKVEEWTHEATQVGHIPRKILFIKNGQ